MPWHLKIRNAVVVLLLGATLSNCGYNTIPTYEEQAKARWSDVQNNYQRRADLIPNLVATVQGYAKQAVPAKGAGGQAKPTGFKAPKVWGEKD